MNSLQLIVSAYLVGLIWLIQLIHYPTFRWVSPDHWAEFHHAHTTWMGVLAGGPMIVSLIVGGWLSWQAGLELTSATWHQHTALACEILAWAVTFLLAVPLHNKLAGGYDAAAISLLIAINWARTAAWTIKLLILVYPVR